MDPRPVGSEIFRQMETGDGSGEPSSWAPKAGSEKLRLGQWRLIRGPTGLPVRVCFQLVLAEQAVEDPQRALGVLVHNVCGQRDSGAASQAHAGRGRPPSLPGTEGFPRTRGCGANVGTWQTR